jgi:hypothetical protein
MVDIFNFHVSPGTPVLEELAEQLEGCLLCIAYAGKSNDKDYIRSSQEYFKRVTKNGKFFENFHMASNDQAALVDSAYYRLIMLDPHEDPEDLANEAKYILWDELQLQEPPTLEVFEEYEKLIFSD